MNRLFRENKFFPRFLSWKRVSVFREEDPLPEHKLESEQNLYKRGIIKAGLEMRTNMDAKHFGTPLAEAIEALGCLAYTGGPPASKCAIRFLSELLELLELPDVPEKIVVSVLKTLGSLVQNNSDCQNICFNLGLTDKVKWVITGQKSSVSTAQWATYCLYCLALDNEQAMTSIKEDATAHVCLEAISGKSWKQLHHNYADIMLKLAGLRKICRDT